MASMPRPSPMLRRYLLATSAPPRRRVQGAPKVRRYRLARVQSPQPGERFAHLRRSYD